MPRRTHEARQAAFDADLESDFAAFDADFAAFDSALAAACAACEAALAAALRSGQLGGAAIDVFGAEPLAASPHFADCPNLLLTPHIAGVSAESNERVSFLIAEKVLEALR